MENNYYYWKCLECGNVHRSDKTQRWHMEHCSCGKTGIDAEIHYIRGFGKTEQITKEEFEKLSKTNKK